MIWPLRSNIQDDAALLAQVAAVLGEHVADFADGAIAIVGGHQHQNGGAARPVAFEHDFVDLAAFQFAGAAHDGALDVVGGHADRLGGDDGRAKPGIHVRVAAAARAAIMISLMMRVNAFPRLASMAAFLCLMVAHFECPDMVNTSGSRVALQIDGEPNKLEYHARAFLPAFAGSPQERSQSGVT